MAAEYLTPMSIIELLVNWQTGTWTVLRNNPRKQACFAASGEWVFGGAPALTM